MVDRAGAPDVGRRTTPGGGLQSVATSLDVLDCFVDSESLGVTEVAQRLGVAKSTAHRALRTMCDRGFVEHDLESGRYRLGLRLYELGQAAAERSRIRRLAMPMLESLRQSTGDTVHLAIPQGGEVLYVARLQTAFGARYLGSVGLRFPAHATGSGKVIAAFDDQVAEACRERGFHAFTSSSIRSLHDFDDALDAVRDRGFAVNDQETVHGLTTVAAAVRDRSGRPYAALSLVGPTSALNGHIGVRARLVTAAAAGLAKELGL